MHADCDQDGKEAYGGEHEIRAHAAHLLGPLGTEQIHWRIVSSPRMPMNASSSRRRAVTVSTPMPACTSAATSCERAMPSTSTAIPTPEGLTTRTPATPDSTPDAASTLSTSR